VKQKGDKKYKFPKRGEENRKCMFCGRMDGLIRKYSLNICRQCFKRKANSLGFKKYN